MGFDNLKGAYIVYISIYLIKQNTKSSGHWDRTRLWYVSVALSAHGTKVEMADKQAAVMTCLCSAFQILSLCIFLYWVHTFFTEKRIG